MPSVQPHRRDYCRTLLPVNDQDGKDEQSLYYCWITIPFSILIRGVVRTLSNVESSAVERIRCLFILVGKP